MKHLLYILLPAACLLGSACGNSTDMAVEQKKTNAAAAAPVELSNEAGVIGVFEMPEMLTLSRLDSANADAMAFQLAKDYSVLEAEAQAIGAVRSGAPGVINYNNDPKNFKFECLLPIKTMPAKTPEKCSIVALEATRMLVYNHYGPYEKLIDAYDRIRAYCLENHLTQSGPMREFYLSDLEKEQDPAKWLTRVMVPVE